jgi:hypothetical protein
MLAIFFQAGATFNNFLFLRFIICPCYKIKEYERGELIQGAQNIISVENSFKQLQGFFTQK